MGESKGLKSVFTETGKFYESGVQNIGVETYVTSNVWKTRDYYVYVPLMGWYLLLILRNLILKNKYSRNRTF